MLAVALACAALGMAVFWPGLEMGFFMDDFLHVAQVQGRDVLSGLGRFELFTFGLPVPERLGPVQGDYLPWFRSPDLLIRFFRPLSVLTYYADHALSGDDPVAYHATNLAWYGGLVAGAVLLFAAVARASGRGLPTILLAGVLFAVAREHEGNVGWVAGRYTLVSAFFCPLALLAYHRWRTTKERRELAWTLVWFGLGLLGSEVAVALSGFFLAYELSLARDRLADRVRGILPVALLAGVWLVFYVGAGYGTKHSTWYIDPVAHPGAFVRDGLGGNLPLNVMRLVLPAALEPEFAPHNVSWLLVRLEHPANFYSWAPTILLVAFALQAVRDRGMRFALIGALVSLVPMSAAPPQQRALLLPTLGIAYAFASFATGAGACLLRPRSLLRPWNLARVALAAALLVALQKDPGGARYRLHQKVERAQTHLARSLALPDELDAAERVLLVTAPSGQELMYAPLTRLQRGHPWPGGFWGISAVDAPHTLVRTGPRSFRLEVEPTAAPAGFLAPQWCGLFRDELDFEVGQAFVNGALTVRLAEVDGAGLVHALEVELDRPLDDPGVWLATFENGAWRRLEAPAVGQRVAIEAGRATWR